MSSEAFIEPEIEPRDPLEAARALVPLIREHADAGERDRRLPSPVVDAFRDRGIFSACRPRALGGGELDPLSAIALFEELARADGSAGWCAMIGAAGGFLEAFLPKDEAISMYGPEAGAVTIGMLAPSGQAAEGDGGYRIRGRWALASGCQHADWLGATALVLDDDTPRMSPQGEPEMVVAMVPASDCVIHDTWHAAGLCGTGSHDVELREVVVPGGRCIRMPMRDSPHPGPLYRFSFLGFLASGIAATALGVARAAIDDFGRLAIRKTPVESVRLSRRPTAQIALADAEAELGAGRAYLIDIVGDTWEAVVDGQEISLAQRARVRLAAASAVRCAARAVDAMYTVGGATALYRESRLQRCFRDVHAMTQHVAVAPHVRELCGRVLLGDGEADLSTL
jgi:indole-3-acetate monooxygenase